MSAPPIRRVPTVLITAFDSTVSIAVAAVRWHAHPGVRVRCPVCVGIRNFIDGMIFEDAKRLFRTRHRIFP